MTPSGEAPSARVPRRPPGWRLHALIAAATILALLGGTVLVLLSPPVVQVGLDYAGSAARLGISSDEAYRLSDRAIRELMVGPGTFAFPMGEGGPRFLDTAEASHLRDVRVVLFGLLLILGTASAILAVGFVKARAAVWFWTAVRAGAVIVVASFLAIGAVLVVAFDAAFTLFHLVFFPGGNWSFDPTRQRMVQLYPTPFWEYAAASLAALSVAAGLAVLWVARRQLRRARQQGPPDL